MQYDGMAWAVALLGVLAVWLALKILFKGNWFLGWLRGTAGLLVLAFALLVGVVAYDLTQYNALPQNQPLATLTFKAEGAERYRVTVRQGTEEEQVTFDGDLWQLDVRVLRFKGLAALIGLEDGYRLEKITGRFLAIEQQALSQKPSALLASSPYGIDLWRWLRLSHRDLFIFEPQALRVPYMPMANGASFSISLTPTGLLAEPLNEAARKALQDWQ